MPPFRPTPDVGLTWRVPAAAEYGSYTCSLSNPTQIRGLVPSDPDTMLSAMHEIDYRAFKRTRRQVPLAVQQTSY